jgi:hypothetical protein
MKTKAPNNLNSTSHDIFYRHFQADAGLSHTEPFQWDDYDGENRQTHLPTLFGADKYTNELARARKWKMMFPHASSFGEN